ncbi:MAG: hypothetical protein MZW92_29630 [Comamonadaceae bacterium]|nr:hypothetical protein [Comamonadaceae bacterium]
MARVFITGSADGLGRAAGRTLLEAGHEVVLHVREPRRQSAVDGLLAQGAELVVERPRGHRADARCRRASQRARRDGRGDPQRWRVFRTRSLAGERRRPVPADCTDPPAAPTDLPRRRHASQRARPCRRHGLERPACDRHVLGRQAFRHRVRRRGRAGVAGRPQPRGGSRVGADEDGRAAGARRPAAGTRDAGVARDK